MQQPLDQSVGQRISVRRQYLDIGLISGQYLDVVIVPGQYLDIALVAGYCKIYCPEMAFDLPTESVT